MSKRKLIKPGLDWHNFMEVQPPEKQIEEDLNPDDCFEFFVKELPDGRVHTITAQFTMNSVCRLNAHDVQKYMADPEKLKMYIEDKKDDLKTAILNTLEEMLEALRC